MLSRFFLISLFLILLVCSPYDPNLRPPAWDDLKKAQDSSEDSKEKKKQNPQDGNP